MADRKKILESLVAALTTPSSDEEDSGQEDVQHWTQSGWATAEVCWESAHGFLEAYVKLSPPREPLVANVDLEKEERRLDEAVVKTQLSEFTNSITCVSFHPGHAFIVVGIDGEYTLIQSWHSLWTMAWWLGDEGPETTKVNDFERKQDVLKPMLEMRNTFSKKFYPFDVFWGEVFKQLPQVSKIRMGETEYEASISAYGEPGFRSIRTMTTVPFDTSVFQ